MRRWLRFSITHVVPKFIYNFNLPIRWTVTGLYHKTAFEGNPLDKIVRCSFSPRQFNTKWMRNTLWASALLDEEPWEMEKCHPKNPLFFQSSPNFIKWGSILEVDDLFVPHCKKIVGGIRSIISVWEPVMLCLVSFRAGVWLLFSSL